MDNFDRTRAAWLLRELAYVMLAKPWRVPVGYIVQPPLPFQDAPSDWLPLEGQLLEREAYPELVRVFADSRAAVVEERYFRMPYIPGAWIRAKP